MVTTGIVGSSMPIANGLAWAAQLDEQGPRRRWPTSATAPSNIGAFHESLNLASVWKLPVIFVCQNNRYAEHTRLREGAPPAPRISDRAAGYGNARCACGRQRRRSLCTRAAREAVRACARGRRPDADRGHDLPISRSRHRRLGRLYAPRMKRRLRWRRIPVPDIRARLIAEGRRQRGAMARRHRGRDRDRDR